MAAERNFGPLVKKMCEKSINDLHASDKAIIGPVAVIKPYKGPHSSDKVILGPHASDKAIKGLHDSEYHDTFKPDKYVLYEL